MSSFGSIEHGACESNHLSTLKHSGTSLTAQIRVYYPTTDSKYCLVYDEFWSSEQLVGYSTDNWLKSIRVLSYLVLCVVDNEKAKIILIE